MKYYLPISRPPGCALGKLTRSDGGGSEPGNSKERDTDHNEMVLKVWTHVVCLGLVAANCLTVNKSEAKCMGVFLSALGNVYADGSRRIRANHEITRLACMYGVIVYSMYVHTLYSVLGTDITNSEIALPSRWIVPTCQVLGG
jgi:hypothetical protein